MTYYNYIYITIYNLYNNIKTNMVVEEYIKRSLTRVERSHMAIKIRHTKNKFMDSDESLYCFNVANIRS